ncbi:MAG: carbohydrate ABC transporter permease [Spirochaetales bacterium]|nr:carbohydrate ABC transporter permease [Spirochaetales bacterium]
MTWLQVRRQTLRTVLYLVLLAQSVVVLFPILLMLVSSVKASRLIFKNPFAFPKPLFLDNYARLFIQQSYERYFFNSVLVSFLAILFAIMATSIASYAIAKYRFRGNQTVFLYFLIGLMLPIRLGTINIMQIFITINLFNSLISLIIIYTAMGIPAGILIFTGFIREIPDELSDAARIDGYGETRIFTSVIVPLLSPAIVVVAVYNLVPVWNDFWFPLILINKDSLMTIPLATARLFGKHETDYGLLFAILSAAAVPPIILFVALSRYFIKGLTAGAIKG